MEPPKYDLAWRCRVCGEMRPDERISVMRYDFSTQLGLPPGTMQTNVRYCNDRAKCAGEAGKADRWKPSSSTT